MAGSGDSISWVLPVGGSVLTEQAGAGPRRRGLAGLVAAALVIGCHATETTAPATSVPQFEQHLEDLRIGSHIPAITAVIAHGQEIVWARGFGLADLATQRAAADTTVYHLASLTKPFAATVIMQLVEEGKVGLDDPVSNYGIHLGTGVGVVRVRHLLSHTSEGTPGTSFSYNGDRFGLLDSVIAHGAGKPFAAALAERIMTPLGLLRTAPNPESPAFDVTGLDRQTFLSNLARGYTYGSSGNIERPSVGASGAIFGLLGGLIAFLLRRRDRLTPLAKSLLTQLLFWAGVNIVMGVSVRLIDNAAHMGGLAAGLVLGLLFRDQSESAPRPAPAGPSFPADGGL